MKARHEKEVRLTVALEAIDCFAREQESPSGNLMAERESPFKQVEGGHYGRQEKI